MRIEIPVLFFLASLWIVQTLILCRIVNLYIMRGKEIKRLQQSISELLKSRKEPQPVRIVTDQMLMDSIRAAIPENVYSLNLAEVKNAKAEDVQMAMNVLRRMNNDHSGSFKRW